jgi:hypothetical protein
LSKQAKNLLDKINEWRKRDVKVSVLNIRQTRNGTALQPHPIKLEGIIIGEESGNIVENSGCYRITHHSSWLKALTDMEHFEDCKVTKQLVKSNNSYAILITAPSEAKA